MATYLILNLTVITAVVLALRIRRPGAASWRRHLTPLAVLLILTVLFDNLMIYLDLFVYNPERISGFKLGLAPIEDFAYPLLAYLLIPALYNRFSTQPPKPPRRHHADNT